MMWAAANDDYDRRRRRRLRSRRRLDGQQRPHRPSTSGMAAKDDDGRNTINADYDGDSDSTSAAKSPRRFLPSSSGGLLDRGGSGDKDGSAGQRRVMVPGGKRRRDDDDDDDQIEQGQRQYVGGETSDGKIKRGQKKKRNTVVREETPEATLSRLQSSYATSMSAVGALHRLSNETCVLLRQRNDKKNDGGGGENVQASDGSDNLATNDIGFDRQPREGEEEQEVEIYHASMKRVAHAARFAFERTLLLDHVILAPVFLPAANATITTSRNNDKKQKNADGRGGSSRRMNDERFHCHDGMKPSSAWLDTWNDRHCFSREIVTDESTSTPESSRSSSTTPTTMSNSQLLIQSLSARWNKFSEAHRRIIRQLSYLALVNYADLLLCGCTCHRYSCESSNIAASKGDLLDRGAVSSLKALHSLPTALFDVATIPRSDQEKMINDVNINVCTSPPPEREKPDRHSARCLWLDDESAIKTIRLALAAYCDASELDPTDPTLWFKLACAARALGRMVDSSSSHHSSGAHATYICPPRSYRSLERLALEHGISSLPRGVPPNRMLVRAWREMEDWDRRTQPVNLVHDEMDRSAMETGVPEEIKDRTRDQTTALVLHLPRYSWETLGRMLIRASQEGASYGRPSVWSTVSILLAFISSVSAGYCAFCRILVLLRSTNVPLNADEELSFFRGL